MTELQIFVNDSEVDIEITLFNGSDNEDALIKLDDADAAENAEAPYQLLEGYFYEYKISNTKYRLREIPNIVSQSKAAPYTGRITPNVFVGTLILHVEDISGTVLTQVMLEVRSAKASYRNDYRNMLQDITEKCTDLIMQINSPVSQSFTLDFHRDSETLYQRFAFLKSVIETPEFHEAVHRITVSPVTSWVETERKCDVRKLVRMNSAMTRQFVSFGNRVSIQNCLKTNVPLTSLPASIVVQVKQDSIDTIENQFIKYALNSFLKLCGDFREGLRGSIRAFNEVLELESTLEEMLSHSMFREVSELTRLPMNSPVLQRKEGYREVLRVWLMSDLAAKLVWSGGEDIYHAGKRDVAMLYEYWVFFVLLDLFSDIFRIDSKALENLIEPTANGLGLKLKSGQCTALKGIYKSTRDLHVEFCFNRTFKGIDSYPTGGSWTRDMRPDYSLSIWPVEFSKDEAERQELIVHLHFDAKYKVESLSQMFGEPEENLDVEKYEQKNGTYKRADLLKMHAYKDAIRRTVGAYIIYPGTDLFNKKGFHEIVPGIGAFPIRPSRNDSGTYQLKAFILEVVKHLLNRTSKREKLTYQLFNLHSEENQTILTEIIPEQIYGIRAMPPDDISVLIGFCKNDAHNQWIINTGMYNARINQNRGSIRLGPREAGADYLLLHSSNELATGNLLKIKNKGARIFTKQELLDLGYIDPSQEFYLMYDVEPISTMHFKDAKWDIRKLNAYKGGRNSGLPFAVSLTELMKTKV